jgi:hypothetical protein
MVPWALTARSRKWDVFQTRNPAIPSIVRLTARKVAQKMATFFGLAASGFIRQG